MPTEKYFNKYPAFPDDVPVAQLPLVSFTKLISQDEQESRKLFQACVATGFFLLDFRGTKEGERILSETETLFEMNAKFHAQDYDQKMKHPFNPPHDIMGYKGLGISKVDSKLPDRFEAYNIGQDDLLGNVPARSNPSIIEEKRDFLSSYVRNAYAVVELILAQLDKYLHLPPGTLASRQPQNKASCSNLRFLHYPPHPSNDQRGSLVGHTDIGTITMLFNVTGGLQILPPDADPKDEAAWKWVKPQPGCAILNMGDAMVEWSGGVLRSNMHRVTFAPGEQAEHSRYSVGYFVRPELNVTMKRLTEGDVIPALEAGEEELSYTAREWEAMKVDDILSGRALANSRGGRKIGITV